MRFHFRYIKILYYLTFYSSNLPMLHFPLRIVSPKPAPVWKVLLANKSTSNVLIGIGAFFCISSNSFSLSVLGFASDLKLSRKNNS